jgi:nitroreductase
MSRSGDAGVRDHFAMIADGALHAMLTGCVPAAAAAPSIHNTQPWRFRVRRTSIDVLADRERQLAVLDPDGRELMISLGAAVLNLRLAMLARGRLPVLRLLPEPRQQDLVARVTAGQAVQARSTMRALAEAIGRRHTNRYPFANRPIPDAVLAELSAAATAEGASLTVLGPVARDAILMLTGSADRTQLADPRYRSELDAWANRPPDRFDGVPRRLHGPRSGARRALPLRDFAPAAADRAGAIFEPHPVIVTLATVADGVAEWLRAGQALERVLLTATVRGLSAGPLTQATEVPELRRMIGDARRRRAVQVVLRLGYGQPVSASPRRPLPEVLHQRQPEPEPGSGAGEHDPRHGSRNPARGG